MRSSVALITAAALLGMSACTGGAPGAVISSGDLPTQAEASPCPEPIDDPGVVKEPSDLRGVIRLIGVWYKFDSPLEVSSTSSNEFPEVFDDRLDGQSVASLDSVTVLAAPREDLGVDQRQDLLINDELAEALNNEIAFGYPVVVPAFSIDPNPTSPLQATDHIYSLRDGDAVLFGECAADNYEGLLTDLVETRGLANESEAVLLLASESQLIAEEINSDARIVEPDSVVTWADQKPSERTLLADDVPPDVASQVRQLTLRISPDLRWTSTDDYSVCMRSDFAGGGCILLSAADGGDLWFDAAHMPGSVAELVLVPAFSDGESEPLVSMAVSDEMIEAAGGHLLLEGEPGSNEARLVMAGADGSAHQQPAP